MAIVFQFSYLNISFFLAISPDIKTDKFDFPEHSVENMTKIGVWTPMTNAIPQMILGDLFTESFFLQSSEKLF